MRHLSPLIHFCKGFCMGAADVVPGVSGGTMALMLGIYERLLKAIRSFDLALVGVISRGALMDAARHIDLGFLAPLGLGIFAALMFFTRVVPLPKLITTHPELVYALFFGLIAASIYVLVDWRRLASVAGVGWLLAGTASGLLLVNLVPMQTPTSAWFIFVCGAVAISAMILPGISGSFILLILQKYAYVFDAVGRLDVNVLVPFALGCCVGLAGFSRLLGWLLQRFHDATLLFIVGILTGSLWVIWPFQERVYQMVRGKQRLIASTPTLPDGLDVQTVAALALIVFGASIVMAIHVMAGRARARD